MNTLEKYTKLHPNKDGGSAITQYVLFEGTAGWKEETVYYVGLNDGDGVSVLSQHGSLTSAKDSFDTLANQLDALLVSAGLAKGSRSTAKFFFVEVLEPGEDPVRHRCDANGITSIPLSENAVITLRDAIKPAFVLYGDGCAIVTMNGAALPLVNTIKTPEQEC